MRSHALIQAQKRYFEKVKHTEEFKEKQKKSLKKFREKNYSKCLEINRVSNRKRYNEDKDIKERKRQYYLANRNYKNLNFGNNLIELFAEQ